MMALRIALLFVFSVCALPSKSDELPKNVAGEYLNYLAIYLESYAGSLLLSVNVDMNVQHWKVEASGCPESFELVFDRGSVASVCLRKFLNNLKTLMDGIDLLPTADNELMISHLESAAFWATKLTRVRKALTAILDRSSSTAAAAPSTMRSLPDAKRYFGRMFEPLETFAAALSVVMPRSTSYGAVTGGDNLTRRQIEHLAYCANEAWCNELRDYMIKEGYGKPIKTLWRPRFVLASDGNSERFLTAVRNSDGSTSYKATLFVNQATSFRILQRDSHVVLAAETEPGLTSPFDSANATKFVPLDLSQAPSGKECLMLVSADEPNKALGVVAVEKKGNKSGATISVIDVAFVNYLNRAPNSSFVDIVWCVHRLPDII